MTERFKANPYTGGPMYYKDNPEAVRKRDAQRMYVNGKEISKKHPLHKPGKYKSLDDAWSHNKIESVDKIYTGRRLIEDISSKSIDTLFKKPFEIKSGEVPEVKAPIPNENFILRNGTKSALATYDSSEDQFVRVDKTPAYGIVPRNSEQAFALAALTNPKIQLVTVSGKAGTGKTLLALASALECRSQYRQIYLARPIVPLSNRDIGYLPGDIQSKIDPYMQPLWDNLGVIRHQFKENLSLIHISEPTRPY